MPDLGSGGCWVESVGPEGVQKVVSALDARPGQWWVLGGECWTRRCTEGGLTPRCQTWEVLGVGWRVLEQKVYRRWSHP